jgi:hypothetical protein
VPRNTMTDRTGRDDATILPTGGIKRFVVGR